MRVLELFAGTGILSRTFRENGHETLTVDIDPGSLPDVCADVKLLSLDNLRRFKPDVVWASPPCQKFSVCTIKQNWNHDRTPRTAEAQVAIENVLATLKIIKALKPRWYFIENPRGMLRKMPFMRGRLRRTVTYCQYGLSIMKPTDIWTNNKNWSPKPKCHYGAGCHIAVPRSNHSAGLQAMPKGRTRSALPPNLCLEIVLACEKSPPVNPSAVLGESSGSQKTDVYSGGAP